MVILVPISVIPGILNLVSESRPWMGISLLQLIALFLQYNYVRMAYLGVSTGPYPLIGCVWATRTPEVLCVPSTTSYICHYRCDPLTAFLVDVLPFPRLRKYCTDKLDTVSNIARSAALVTDVAILCATWIKTWRLRKGIPSMDPDAIGNQPKPCIALLLFRDGASYWIFIELSYHPPSISQVLGISCT